MNTLTYEINEMLMLRASRNNSRYERQCKTKEEWALWSDMLLSQGFMISIDSEGLFGVLNSKGDVNFIKDLETWKGFLC